MGRCILITVARGGEFPLQIFITRSLNSVDDYVLRSQCKRDQSSPMLFMNIQRPTCWKGIADFSGAGARRRRTRVSCIQLLINERNPFQAAEATYSTSRKFAILKYRYRNPHKLITQLISLTQNLR